MSSELAPSPQGEATPSAPVLALRNVFAGYGRSTVVRDVSFEIPAGKIVALLGPNGAGKTTLLRTAAGLIKPTAGAVVVCGDDMTTSAPNKRARAGLCLIPEGRGIFRNLTVRENLRLQVPKWSKNTDVDRALEAFPVLQNRLTQLAGSMSGGQQQMLALARCYLSNPRVVLFDEVSMGLAPLVVEEIFESVQQLAASGVALLLVEQYVNRAMEMADIVVLLDRGEVTFNGPPSQLEESAVLRGYLGIELEGSN